MSKLSDAIVVESRAMVDGDFAADARLRAGAREYGRTREEAEDRARRRVLVAIFEDLREEVVAARDLLPMVIGSRPTADGEELGRRIELILEIAEGR